MEFKQSQQKYLENIKEATRKLLPAVPADTVINGQLMLGWLIKNCAEAEGQIIDASVENIIRAIKALDVAGLVDWQTPPKPQKKRPDVLQTTDGNRVNHARENKLSELDFQMAEEKRRRQALGDAANAETMAEAAAIVRNHSSVSHSRTAREKAVLKTEFDRLIAAKVHPKDVLAGVKAKQDTFANGDVTRLTFGSRK
jgi:hypothetical protein